MVRNLEIIGEEVRRPKVEAVKNVSQGLRDANPVMPWKRIAGMRDKMIHEYLGVNLRLVFDVVRRELPNLDKQIQAILETSSK